MRHLRRTAPALCALPLILGLAAPAARSAGVPACVESGTASYYGPGFDGNLTANGEIFDAGAMTAAHRDLPLGTEIEVTLLETGETIAVTVNDRGPYIDGRILDLSEGAAAELGMTEDGLAEVRVEVFVEDQDDPTIREILLRHLPAPHTAERPCPAVTTVASVE